jgi:uncharacterized membrane protein YqiK
MEQFLPLIIIGVIGLIARLLWYIVTRFLVNIGATEVGIKERRYLGRRMPQGRVVANAGEVGIQAEVLKPGLHFVPYPIERVTKSSADRDRLTSSASSKRSMASRCRWAASLLRTVRNA